MTMNNTSGRVTMIREDAVKEAFNMLIKSTEGLTRWSMFSSSDLAAMKMILDRYGRNYDKSLSSCFEVFSTEIRGELEKREIQSLKNGARELTK